MRRRLGLLILASLLSLPVFQSCNTRTLATAPTVAVANQIQSKSQYIDNSLGGSVFLPDGAGVQIPAGAFNQSTTVSVSRNPATTAPDMGASYSPLKYVYYFNSGGASFTGSVTITLPYNAADLPAGHPEGSLLVVYYNGAAWVSVPATLDVNQKTLTAVTNHFSPWAPAVPAVPTDTPTFTPTATSTPTGTWFTSTPTSTPKGTYYTNTFTPTDTWTFTPVPTSTYTPCGLCTFTNTFTETYTLTFTNTPTGTWLTSTPTPSPTGTYYTDTFTPTDTWTLTPSFTWTYTPCVFCTPTFTWPWTATPTFTNTPTGTWYTSTPTPTPTGTYYSDTFTPTDTWTLTPTQTWTYTPCGLCTSTNTFTPTQTSTFTPAIPTNSFTFTPSCTPTNTPTLTSTPTGTWFTPTFTVTPTFTLTNCITMTCTSTACCTPTYTYCPPIYLSGSVTYSGTGTVGMTSPIVVTANNGTSSSVYSNGGNYFFSICVTGVYNLSVFYQFNSYNKPGMRCATSGACGNPIVAATYPVTISGAPGTTVTGPSLTISDSCSYEGLYGNVSYAGAKGMVQYCRMIHLQSYSDAAFTTAMPYQIGASNNNGSYVFVTNDGNPGTTGLTPLYLKAWFDVNGDGVFDTGDPYIQLGPITPSADGLLQNISFDDTYVK